MKKIAFKAYEWLEYNWPRPEAVYSSTLAFQAGYTQALIDVEKKLKATGLPNSVYLANQLKAMGEEEVNE